MDEIKEVSVTPSVLPETQKVMDDMRAQGHTFEGDKPKEPEPKEIPVVAPKEELKEPEKLPTEEKEHPQRTPREPKMIPAWQVEIEKKRLEKERETNSTQEKQEWKDAIKDLQSQILTLTGTKHEKEEVVDEWIDRLVAEKGVDVDSGFLKDFASELLKRVPKSESKIPDDLPKTLEAVAKMEAKAKKESEDSDYITSFREQVVPKLKEEYPQITEDEIGSIREAMKKPYFSERFINLSSSEIYDISKGTFKDLVAPERRATVERGTKGVSRNQKVLDYSNLTEDDYTNMSPQEREDANKFLLNK